MEEGRGEIAIDNGHRTTVTKDLLSEIARCRRDSTTPAGLADNRNDRSDCTGTTDNFSDFYS